MRGGNGGRMSIRIRMAIVVLVVFVGGIWCAAPVVACNIPVFRYALERWLPDAYTIVIFQRDPLSDGQQQAIDYLRQASAEGGGHANVTVRLVDLSGEVDPPTRALWQRQASAQLPHMVLAYPRPVAGRVGVWAGPLSMANAEAIVASPARRRVAQRLLADESAVWVLVGSGDSQKDEAAADLLSQQLSQLPESLTLVEGPIQADTTGDDRASRPAPRVGFSLLRLSRTDPAERVFLAMLLGSEPDLVSRYASQPIAFPVFGRGRALYALVGKGINPRNIAEACAYLVGMCSCEAKLENPGTDLLFSADWDGSVAYQPAAVPKLPALIGPIDATPGPAPGNAPGNDIAAAVPTNAAPAPLVAAAGASGGALLRNILIAVAAIVVAVAGLVLFVSRRPSRS